MKENKPKKRPKNVPERYEIILENPGEIKPRKKTNKKVQTSNRKLKPNNKKKVKKKEKKRKIVAVFILYCNSRCNCSYLY